MPPLCNILQPLLTVAFMAMRSGICVVDWFR